MASRGLGRPLWIRYTDWLVHVLTLDWGLSWSAAVPVYTMVKQYTIRSATYVIPSVLVSSVGGALVGFYSAANRYTLPDRVSTILAYVGVGIPNFWLAAMAIIFIQGEEIGYLRTYIRVPEFELSAYLLPAILLSVVLLGNQSITHARRSTKS